jgi:hypothetical protein
VTSATSRIGCALSEVPFRTYSSPNATRTSASRGCASSSRRKCSRSSGHSYSRSLSRQPGESADRQGRDKDASWEFDPGFDESGCQQVPEVDCAGLCVIEPAQVFPLVGSLLLALALKAALTTITFGALRPARAPTARVGIKMPAGSLILVLTSPGVSKFQVQAGASRSPLLELADTRTRQNQDQTPSWHLYPDPSSPPARRHASKIKLEGYWAWSHSTTRPALRPARARDPGRLEHRRSGGGACGRHEDDSVARGHLLRVDRWRLSWPARRRA